MNRINNICTDSINVFLQSYNHESSFKVSLLTLMYIKSHIKMISD